jgi:hypothetical protein
MFVRVVQMPSNPNIHLLVSHAYQKEAFQNH